MSEINGLAALVEAVLAVAGDPVTVEALLAVAGEGVERTQVEEALDFVRMLGGYQVEATPEGRNPGGGTTPSRQSAKITRFSPFSAQAEAGNVKVLRGDWNGRWFDELEAFPEAKHDDSADSTARAFSIVGLGGGPLVVSDDVLSMLGRK